MYTIQVAIQVAIQMQSWSQSGTNPNPICFPIRLNSRGDREFSGQSSQLDRAGAVGFAQICK